ncbi:hypothetical protein CCMA1212_008616 [Trichoderma ghanense]|uniref:Uncharacterized protein n=1 Tax=Trichoderma ghanense TaxID=65468 RepID=A0ABY2GW46_9HYPO
MKNLFTLAITLALAFTAVAAPGQTVDRDGKIFDKRQCACVAGRQCCTSGDATLCFPGC